MGMVGQLYVRPRQNRVPAATFLAALQSQQLDPRTSCNSAADILCSNPLPAAEHRQRAATGKPRLQRRRRSTGTTSVPAAMRFDPNFHFVGMTFNPEGFADMKDKYFLLNGRSYPDTVGGGVDPGGNVVPGAMTTQTTDGVLHVSQPLTSVVNIPAGGKALLRISSLDVSEYQTLSSLGIPMTVIALNAKLLRDQGGNNLYYNTNSITLGGGESLDVILDASDTTQYPSGSVFYLYTPNLDHLSNDAENFGGLMTEVRSVRESGHEYIQADDFDGPDSPRWRRRRRCCSPRRPTRQCRGSPPPRSIWSHSRVSPSPTADGPLMGYGAIRRPRSWVPSGSDRRRELPSMPVQGG
jgi:hypothetical protein